jgi:hypothetical protein
MTASVLTIFFFTAIAVIRLSVTVNSSSDCIRLLFWSGQTFREEKLKKEGSFKAAEIRYTSADQIDTADLKRWLKKAREIQWDYKNIVKRKGQLKRLK